MSTYMEHNYIWPGTCIFYRFLLFKCTTSQHKHSFNIASFSTDLNNDTLHFESPKHVTNTILQLQKRMGKKRETAPKI